MRTTLGYGIVRWSLVLVLLVIACLYLADAVVSAWQTAAPAGAERAGIWSYLAYRSFGRGLAAIFLAVLASLNIRSDWPNLRSMWNLFLGGAVLASLLVPSAWRLLSIDACLDSGGSWDYEYELCSTVD